METVSNIIWYSAVYIKVHKPRFQRCAQGYSYKVALWDNKKICVRVNKDIPHKTDAI